MAIPYRIVPKKNSLVSPPEVKYYPIAVSRDTVDLDKLARKVSQASTMSEADCYGVIIALTEQIAHELRDGNIVKLDRLGTLQLTISSTGAANRAELTRHNIKGTRVVYRPSKELKFNTDNLKFEKIGY